MKLKVELAHQGERVVFQPFANASVVLETDGTTRPTCNPSAHTEHSRSLWVVSRCFHEGCVCRGPSFPLKRKHRPKNQHHQERTTDVDGEELVLTG